MTVSGFDRIPSWNGTDKSFEVLADDIHGRIPVTKVKSWREFTNLLEDDFFNRSDFQLIFRGHRRFDWPLMPTLARFTENGIVTEKLADKQLEAFKKAVRGRLKDSAMYQEGTDDELWSIGQHHGLMTPLLDWTYSPYVALFFAFSKEDSEEETENSYRAIYVLNKSFVASEEMVEKVRLFEPKKDEHGRLVNQAGLFTFSPYDSTIEIELTNAISSDDFEDESLRTASEDEQAGVIAKYICKILIPNEDRVGCMRHLRRMNVHHASLFPDLIGASEYCNLLVSEEQKVEEVDQSKSEVVHKDVARATINSLDSSIDTDEYALQIAYILFKYDSGRSASKLLNFIAEHLAKIIKNYLVVDWCKRDSAVAKIRSLIRVTLRKNSYPEDVRDDALDDIVEYLMSQDNPAGQEPEQG